MEDLETDKMMKAREELRKRLGMSQTGGKGTVRRKKKTSNVHIISSRLNPEEKEYSDIIDRVNNEISNIKGDRYELWYQYLVDYMIDIGTDFKKKDFKKNSRFNLDYMREHYEDFFYQYLLKPVSGKYMFKKDYSLMKNQFSEKGYLYLLGNIRLFAEVIQKEEYLENNGEEEAIVDVSKFHEVLDIPNDSVPEKSVIKKAYLKKSTKVHPDKHPDEYDKYNLLFQEVQTAYRTLVKYYYPNTISNVTPDIS